MKLPSLFQVAAVFAFIMLACQTQTSQQQVNNEKDPLLQLLMNNPIYREHILDPPSRKQDTLLKILRHSGASDLNVPNLEPPGNSLLNDKSRASKELLVAPAYTQDPLLRQLLSKYHEDFLSALTPPDHKQNPLFQQLKSKKNGSVNQPLVLPRVNQNPLLRNLPNTKQVPFNTNIISVPSYRQDPLLRILKPEFENNKNIFSPPTYKQDPLLRQLGIYV